MAISNEALSIRASRDLSDPRRDCNDGKVARLEHFLGRRGPDHRHRADPARSTRTVSMKSSMS